MTTPAFAAEAAVYGRSLLLADGDLVVRDGSLVMIAGRANLEQGLMLRILTPWGDDRLTATYGLDATDVFTVGLPRALAKEVLRLNLVRTLAGDPRVASVDQVLFDDDPAYLAAHPEAAGGAPAGRRVAVVEVTVQPVSPRPGTGGGAVSGAQLAATAGGSLADLAAITLSTDVRW
ncbi:MAG TPA: hypothetical protein VFN19_11300 [Candidatus Nanopelagicales bacterium]|nr:hypothetical protein [Candidatus Nanopelagicales bacterium]